MVPHTGVGVRRAKVYVRVSGGVKTRSYRRG